MGRPTFKIDPVRLRALREEQGLTQAAIAKKVAQHLGKPVTEDITRHYQRVEDDGQTSIEYAKALATVLKVSVPLLQGLENPDPFLYLQYIQRLLKEQLGTGTNDALQKLLKRHVNDDEEKALEYLTEDIAELIEQVLLVRNPAEIADLVQLTGLSEEELLAPANVRGFWFISVRSRGVNCTEVVDGVSSVNFRIGEIMREFLSIRGSDSTLRMWRDNPWISIEIYRPQVRDRMRIDFTRVQPDTSGLRWIDATWRDDLFLIPGITEHAYANADVVTDFSDKTSPGDLHRLRLVVTEHDRNFGKILRRMVVRGYIDEIPETVKQNFSEECHSRILFVNWLTAGLREALMPHLVLHPASSWHLSTNGAAAVDIKITDPRFPSVCLAELRYRIMLAEEVSPGTFEPVPVREKDLHQLRKKIEEWLAEGYVLVDGADPAPNFEPV